MDFVCDEAKLVIEVDGAPHSDAHEISYDEKRTVYLQSRGYQVFRCYNIDVFENLNGVLDGILRRLNGQ